MKHFLTAAILALPLSVFAEKEACAWSKFNLGIGANVGIQSGGNKSVLWGAWRSNDYPQQNCAGQMSPACMGGCAGAMPAMPGMPAETFDQGPMPQSTPEPTKAKPAQYQQTYQGQLFLPVGYEYVDPNSYYATPWYEYGN